MITGKVTNVALKKPLTLQSKLVKIVLRYFVNIVCALYTSYSTRTKSLLGANVVSRKRSHTIKLLFTKF